MNKKRKTVYLTIDDCPSKDFKKKIDFLIEKKIPAILFCTGKGMEKYRKEIIYAIKNGFIIGNHSYSHRHFLTISLRRAEFEVKKTDKIIDKLYKKANVKRKFKLFRFPYGDKGFKIENKKIQNILKKYSYKQPKFKNINYKWYERLRLNKGNDVFWTYDISEYRLKRLEEVLKRILKINGRMSNLNSYEIVLIHDHARTTGWFFKIIERLIKMNIRFIIPKE